MTDVILTYTGPAREDDPSDEVLLEGADGERHLLRFDTPTKVPSAVADAANALEDHNFEVGTADEREENSKLTGDALKERATELDIEGRADMSADELRDAVAKAEADAEENE